MPGFNRFGKVWASAGPKVEYTDEQASTGFDYMGEATPEVEQFNAFHRDFDEKDNWLYNQFKAFADANGITVTEVITNILTTGVNRASNKFQSSAHYMAPGSFTFTVPADVYKIWVEICGGGGGGGGSWGPNSAGSGGGAGAYAEGWINTTPGTNLALVVGQGGTAGNAASASNGVGGGLSRVGNFIICPGGTGGIGSYNAGTASPGGTGGIMPSTNTLVGGFAAGGDNGGIGVNIQQDLNYLGGLGGPPFNSGSPQYNSNSTGFAGRPGGGGGNGGSRGGAGGPGAAGWIKMFW